MRADYIQQLESKVFLTKSDIREIMGVGWPRACAIFQAARKMTELSGYENLSGKVHYSKVMEFLRNG